MTFTTEMVLVRPVEGAHVRCPETRQPLPREGKRVVLSSYWQRRILAGDVIVVEEP